MALPTLARDLDATDSQLQWIVDSYTLVFAGLLLTAGALGDRFGRKGALTIGLVIFGVGSVVAVAGRLADQLIVARAVMGIGAAFIMPATLSIITNVFTDPDERAKAIGIWAGVAGLGVASVRSPAASCSSTSGGARCSSSTCRSSSLARSSAASPASRRRRTRDAAARPRSARVLSIVGLARAACGRSSRRPSRAGRRPARSPRFARRGRRRSAAFVAWESRIDAPDARRPLLPQPAVHRRQRRDHARRSSRCSASCSSLTQYLQFVLGYSPLEAGIRIPAVAVGDDDRRAAVAQARRAGRHQARRRHRPGHRRASAWCSTLHLDADSGYPRRWRDAACSALGMGLDDGAGDRVDHGLAAAAPRPASARP